MRIARVCFELLLVSGLAAAQQVPLGDEFQIITYPMLTEARADVGVDADGDFVVVWESWGSYGDDDSGVSIQARRFDSNGLPFGNQTQVNSIGSGHQNRPRVAVAPSGSFVVVWQSVNTAYSGDDHSDYSIQGQRYDSNGDRAGYQFQVNTYTTDDQRYPAVAIDAEGDFVVVWTSDGSNGTDDLGTSIQGQRYSSDGSRAGAEFQVNSYKQGNQFSSRVGMNADGDFVVVWESTVTVLGGSDDSDRSIQGRIFNSNGVAIGPQAQVNTYTTGNQRAPDVGVDQEGNFAVVWASDGWDGEDDSSWSIQGRIYTSTGVAIGSQEQVNTYSTDSQRFPAVDVDADGNFVVVWSSYGSDGNDSSDYSIQGRLYGSNAQPAGDDFQINSHTTDKQRRPAVGLDDRGRFAVVWYSLGSSDDISEPSIQGQRFTFGLFKDGFESGDTTAWSSSVPDRP